MSQPATPAFSSSKAMALSARLHAVQAVYQLSQNKQPMDAVIEEYLQHRAGMEMDGETLVMPDGALLKKILVGVGARMVDLQALVEGNLKRPEGEGARSVEPLLMAILLCGAFELLAKDMDSPIIINDYLNVAHGFYEKGEVALVNGVLDAISSLSV